MQNGPDDAEAGGKSDERGVCNQPVCARRLTESWDRGRGGAGVSDGPERECGIVLEAGCINVSGSSVGFRAGKCSARDLPGLQCGWDAVMDGFASYFTGNGKTCREDGTGL